MKKVNRSEPSGNTLLLWIKAFFSLLLILASCTPGSFQGKMDAVDDTGRETWVRLSGNFDPLTAFETETFISGTAHDGGGIDRVELKINDGEYVPVSGKENWHKSVILKIGENILRARVINDKGTVIYSDPVYVQCLWKKAGQLPQPLSFQNVLAHNNYFYILGGWIFDWDFIPALDIFWKYDPVNNTTQEYSPSLVHPFYLSSTVVYNGKFYALGGLKKKSGKGCARNEWVDIYSPAGSYDYGDIRSISSTAYVRGGAAYSRIGNTVYLFGGNDNDGNPTDTILTYNLDTDTWSDTGLRLDHPRAYASAVQYNGKIFIFAGKTDSGYSRSVTIFDPPSTLVRLDDRLKYSRGGAGVVRVNHKVYLLGGEGEGGYLNAVEVFNLDTYVSYELRKMPFSLGYMGAAAYEDKILIFGGKNEDGFYSKSDIYHYHPLEDDLNITN